MIFDRVIDAFEALEYKMGREGRSCGCAGILYTGEVCSRTAGRAVGCNLGLGAGLGLTGITCRCWVFSPFSTARS